MPAPAYPAPAPAYPTTGAPAYPAPAPAPAYPTTGAPAYPAPAPGYPSYSAAPQPYPAYPAAPQGYPAYSGYPSQAPAYPAPAPSYPARTATAPGEPVTIAAPAGVRGAPRSRSWANYQAIVLFAGSDGFGYGAGYRGQWAVGGDPVPLAMLDAKLAIGVDLGIATRDAGPGASVALVPMGLTMKAVRAFGPITAAARAGVAGVFSYTSIDPTWSLDLTIAGLTGVEARYGLGLLALDVLAGKGTSFLLSAGLAF